jgi:urease accessory protein
VLAEIGPRAIRIRPDHVIAAMLRGLGAEVRAIVAPFQPEGGAYAERADGHGHAPAHGHGHGHGH